MAQASTVQTPQRGIVGVELSELDLANLNAGLAVRVPNGRYFIDIVPPVDDGGEVDDAIDDAIRSDGGQDD